MDGTCDEYWKSKHSERDANEFCRFPDVLPSEEGLQAESSENESESSQAEQS